MNILRKIILWLMPAFYLLVAAFFFFRGVTYLSPNQNIIMAILFLVYSVFRFYRSYRITRQYLNLVIIAVLLSSCSGNSTKNAKDTPTTGNIKVVVDETFLPVVNAELDVFHSVYRYAHIKPVALPENDAFNQIFNDSARLILATRKMTDKEVQYFNAKKIFPKQVKIATDAIAVIVNRDNPDSVFTMTDIVSILKGEITSWDQLNKNNHFGPLELVFDNPESGVVRYMVDSVAKTTNLSNHLTAQKGNVDVIKYVFSHRNAVGLIGVSWVSDREDTTHLTFQSQIRVARIGLQRSDVYKPYQAYIATKQYPMTRDIYLISTDPHLGLADGFISFAASDKGQRIILKSGIVPATAPIRLIQVNEY